MCSADSAHTALPLAAAASPAQISNLRALNLHGRQLQRCRLALSQTLQAAAIASISFSQRPTILILPTSCQPPISTPTNQSRWPPLHPVRRSRRRSGPRARVRATSVAVCWCRDRGVGASEGDAAVGSTIYTAGESSVVDDDDEDDNNDEHIRQSETVSIISQSPIVHHRLHQSHNRTALTPTLLAPPVIIASSQDAR